VEFGAQDSYQLHFALDGLELKRLMEQVGGGEAPAAPLGVGSNLAKLRAILDLARTLQSSFSIDEVLVSVVDTALTITGAERGFLLLRSTPDAPLETRVARNKRGQNLRETDLRVPREVIRRALEHRRELLSMNFEPLGADETRPQNSIVDLELRSVICVPLVRIRAGQSNATSVMVTGNETVGVLYMDSRVMAADLAGGNRELLQTLAIEASTVLENARLLQEEQSKHQLEDELRLARTIQQSLLPRSLPSDGWLRASGSSLASHEVGGDYYDVTRVSSHCWSAVVADVSGKGVSSALLASLLQGSLITVTEHPEAMGRRMERLNRFLLERTGGEKYATVFHALLHEDGRMLYVNAAHCPPMVVRANGERSELEVSGMPVGLVETAEFLVVEQHLAPGDKIVIYSDGVTEAQNLESAFFGKKRLREVVQAHATDSCAAIHDAVQDAIAAFTEGAAQSDDITLLVLEFRGAA
jgi:sigma-B regulation protein RsbU (phosphoserine phosphatase)